MFTDETLDCVEFKSSWRKERLLSDNYAQTREILTDEVAVQAKPKTDTGVQTEEESPKDVEFIEDNSQNLVNFLLRVYPDISAQLQKNSRSHAFDGYEVNWEEETLAVECIHTLTNADLKEELEVTGISWNSTGSVLAASYGRFDHEDWCTHKSCLCTWNVDRHNININKPDHSLDLASCLMCIAYHPNQTSWIAGGTFNGEVLVWDTSKEDDMLVASSGIGDDSHREPVSKVQWILDPESKGKKYKLVSISSDGKILVWQVYVHQEALKLVDGFILLTESLPRSMRTKSKRGDTEMGVTCLSVNHEDKSTFVLGSESGGVFKCSMFTKGTPASREVQSSVPLHSPVTFTFSPHHGPVYAVECSPYHRNLFLTCSSDMSARLYSMLQAPPIMSIEPGAGYLFSAKWSPVRPLVFAVTTEDGQLLIYDLKTSMVTPVQKLEASPKKSQVYTLQFNTHQRHLLATGDGVGYIRVFRLSDELATQAAREEEKLAEIYKEATAE